MSRAEAARANEPRASQTSRPVGLPAWRGKRNSVHTRNRHHTESQGQRSDEGGGLSSLCGCSIATGKPQWFCTGVWRVGACILGWRIVVAAGVPGIFLVNCTESSANLLIGLDGLQR